LLRRRLADQQVVILAHELHDGLIESSPPVRIDVSNEPDSAITAISSCPDVVTMLPVGVSTGSPTPIARHRSATMYIPWRRRLRGVATARFSTSVIAGHAHITLGARGEMTIDDGLEEKRSIFSVTSKSAMSRLQRTDARMPRRAAEHALRFEPMPLTLRCFFDRDDGGSFNTIPSPAHRQSVTVQVNGDFVRRLQAPF